MYIIYDNDLFFFVDKISCYYLILIRKYTILISNIKTVQEIKATRNFFFSFLIKNRLKLFGAQLEMNIRKSRDQFRTTITDYQTMDFIQTK